MSNRKTKKSNSLGKLSRHRKTLFLPMDQQAIAQLMIPIRLALEGVRSGRTEPRSALCLMQCTVLTKLITQAGFGLLDDQLLQKNEADLVAVITHEKKTGEWQFEADLIERLVQMVNEHDRQLRETRLQIVAEACEAFDRIAKHEENKKVSKSFESHVPCKQ